MFQPLSWWCGVCGVVGRAEGTQAKPVQSVMMLCSVYVGSSPSAVHHHHHTTPLYSSSGRILLYYHQQQQAEEAVYEI